MTRSSGSSSSHTDTAAIAYEVQFEKDGKTIRVPLHECDIVQGERRVASLRQNGWMTTESFRLAWPSYSTDEVEDLGDA